MNDEVALVAITGATGFVGGAVVRRLLDKTRHSVRVAVRGVHDLSAERVDVVNVESLAPDNRWESFVTGADVVIHCAARVHVLNEQSAEPDQEYFRANVTATLNLAEQAAAAGVRRFIFLSSIKANGEFTLPGAPFRADDPCRPLDAYGISKQKAEEGLRELAARTGMQVVIIRPVLVYGPGVKANFMNMMRWLDRGIPLPLGAIHNRRSLVAVDNLADLILVCIHHPAAANQTFLVSDGDDVSTTRLLRTMGHALGKPARLLPVPAVMLNGAAALLGKRAFSQRLCSSLQVDISKTCTMLEWRPPVSIEDAMRDTARYFLGYEKPDHDKHD
ncbi:UDP-glucose 4-epimerase family protein [Pseudomonas syringae]|uniref:UDP-glucose 4-epimerase family protein n=1 Tax=Pseudomonas syringae TaxID=317 RepID=UPI000736F651|nr:SDR family oxidoreductase [Pseudomonas syringae]KTB85835.1 NAD-dependent dehydratase [Pseudomonas syringae pv. syringae PD2766]